MMIPVSLLLVDVDFKGFFVFVVVVVAAFDAVDRITCAVNYCCRREHSFCCCYC